MRSSALGLVVLALLCGCSSSSGSSKTSSAVGGGSGSGSVDPELVGSWYAGRGGTQIAYDTSTGTFGAPSGTGMMFVFHADGTYLKGVQSIESGACTTGYVVVETGVATTSGDQLHIHPTRGTMHEYSCGGTADTEHPTDIADETLTWTYDPSAPALELVDGATGASATFQATH